MSRFEIIDDAKPRGRFEIIDETPSTIDRLKGVAGDYYNGLGNVAAGAVRGAGSIGATILTPFDAAARAIGVHNSFIGRNDRRTAMDDGLRSMGADTDSMAFGAGKIGTEIAGTAGVGGVLAKGAALLPGASKAAPFIESLASSGFKTGLPAAPFFSKANAVNTGIRAAGGAISGGAQAGLANPEDAKSGTMIGGGLPIAANVLGNSARGAGRLLAGSPASPEVRALADRAAQLKIDIPADRIADSKPLNAIAAGLNYVPFSGRAATEAKMQNQLNSALSRTFGQNSDNVTMALRKAQSDLGGEFDRVLKSNTVKVDSAFLTALADAEQKAIKELGSDGAKIIKNQIDEIMAKVSASGEIDGQAAYNIKKTLDRIGKRNAPEAFYALDLKGDLMGALNRSLPAQEAAGFATTRQQYGNMLSLQKLAQNGVDGDVSIARMANMKGIRNPDLQELADISAQFLKPREGNHGAAQRAFAGMGAGFLGGAPAFLGGIAAGRGVNTALNSNMARQYALGNPQFQNMGLLGGGYKIAPLLGSD